MFASLVLSFLSFLSCELIVAAYQLKTNQGILDGTLSKSRNGTAFYSFYAIPYAKPPVGELRFETPQEATSWEGVRDAKTPPPVCVQTSSIPSAKATLSGSEDCLYLNVFTPNVTFSSLRPVMVYIHGGAFNSGSGAVHGPEYFMDYPVVVVTIQYRLAILGFLSAADEILPGNYGMKDQIKALKWVQRNIEVFGGDPKRVTIMGESSGAASVHLHLHSVSSSGLFHRAISQSGTALSVWAVINSETAKERARALGVLVGCPKFDSKALVKCLRKVPAEQLVLAHDKFFIFDSYPIVVFGPVVEPKNASDAFLVENPWRQKVINSVPLLLGTTSDEGSLHAFRIRSLPAQLNEWSRHYDRLIPLVFYLFDRTDLKDNISAVATSIKKFYIGDEDINFKIGQNFSNMFADGISTVTSLEAARRHNNEVFYYLYDHKNNHSTIESFGYVTKDLDCACHGDELVSQFHLKGMLPPVTEGTDYVVSQRMLNQWVNFIVKGDPNGSGQIWKPFDKENFTYLHIKTDSDVMDEKLIQNRYKFWKETVFSSRELSS